jgi:serine phosphatase RsbU (regulator of sigma subunit)
VLASSGRPVEASTVPRLAFAPRRPADANPLVVGLVVVGVLAVLYPLLADRTQHPLAIFVVPIVLAAALGTGRQTAMVAGAAFAIALLEGALEPDLDTSGLLARLFIVVTTAVVGIAVAVQRGRRQQAIDEAHARALLVEAFQSSLTPAPAPPADVSVQVRFRPGDERLRLGGDFVDAIRLPTGQLGYVIGDVCGHGPLAAGFGAAVRSAWKALATVEPNDPVAWVDGLEATFFRLGRHAGTFVTLNTGVLDVAARRLRFVSAGHPWPLLIGDTAEVVSPHVGPPLGVELAGRWQLSEVCVPADATVLLYTDGLTENRMPGGGRAEDEQPLVEYVSRHGRFVDLDELLRHFGPNGFDDDVAVLTLRYA